VGQVVKEKPQEKGKVIVKKGKITKYDSALRSKNFLAV